MLDEEIDIEQAVITHQLPSACVYNFGNSTFTLLDAIDGLPSDELRNFAFAVFTRYPIGAHFDDTDEALILQDWFFTVSGTDLNALNLAIVAANEGLAFSLPLAKELSTTPLTIYERASSGTRSVRNLFGHAANTTAIIANLKAINIVKKGLLDQLQALLGECTLSAQFKDEFAGLTTAEQTSVLTYFTRAAGRNLKTRFYPDTKIVKDVTPDKYKCSVYELRIYLPSAIRVYFNEGEDRVCLSSIGYKNRQKQSAEIVAAHKTLHKMILTKK